MSREASIWLPHSGSRLYDLVGAQTRGAYMNASSYTIHLSSYPLNVRIPSPLGPSMRMAYVHAERRFLPANLTNCCHDSCLHHLNVERNPLLSYVFTSPTNDLPMIKKTLPPIPRELFIGVWFMMIVLWHAPHTGARSASMRPCLGG